MPRPLIVTADLDLLDDLLRLCAAAGTEAKVAHDVAAARVGWVDPPVVLIGSDLAVRTADANLPRRTGVVLVGRRAGEHRDEGLWEIAVRLGAEQVAFLPTDQALMVDRLGATIDGRADAVTVAVVGGRGGAGATTLAAALAVTAAHQGVDCMLIDADPVGGGIDLALGAEDVPGLRWSDLAASGGRVSGVALRDALPLVHGVSVLSWDRGDAVSVSPEAIRSVLDAARRTSDLVVVDLPRHVDEATRYALSAVGRTLLVVPAEVRATAAAARVATTVGLITRDLRVVVRGPSPAGLTGPLVADALGLPLAGWLPAEPGLDVTLERGQPPTRPPRGPLATFCAGLLADLGLARTFAA